MSEEFKVRAVDFEEKSRSEAEEEIINSIEDTTEEVTEEVVEDTVEDTSSYEIKEEDVLSHIKNRYNKEINSIDELFQEREAQEELDEETAAFFKYKKETGRGIDDFVKLNRDIDKLDPNKLLIEFYKDTMPELDDDDISIEMDRFSYDEDFDDEKEIKQKELAKKKELAKAREYFNKQKEQYKVPLESRGFTVPVDERDTYEAFKANKGTASTEQEEMQKKSEYFAAKTNELFSEKFEGFGFNIGENNKKVYKPAEAQTLKEQQMNLQNFVGKFLDDKGYLKDAEAFHKAIAVASDPDRFANFFYEQGKADMATDITKDSKNIDMVRNAPTPMANKTEAKVRSVDDGNTKGLKFKKR